MKYLITVILIVVSLSSKAQKAEIIEDTLKYNGKAYHLGDTINVWYGSKPNKDFAFIYHGNMMAGVTEANSGISKMQAYIDKIYKTRGKCYFRARLIDAGAQFGMKLFIDVEGAVDNNEIK